MNDKHLAEDELDWWEDGHEEELRLAFADDCPERATISLATSFARALIIGSPVFVKPGPPPEEQSAYLLLAAQLSAVRMLRAARAATAALSVGYEPEARGLIRVMVELAAHAEYWSSDPTGGLALQWLEGKHRFGLTKKVEKILDPDIYAELNVDAHGDPRSLLLKMDPEDHSISMGPDRTMDSRTYLLVMTDAVIGSAHLLANQFDSDSEKHFEMLGEERARAWRILKEDRRAAPG